MAAALETLYVEIEARLGTLEAQLTRAQSSGATVANRIQGSFDQAFSSIGSLASKLGGALVVGALAGGLQGLAEGALKFAKQASQADTAAAIFDKTILRFGQNAGQADALVAKLVDQFGVLPTQVEAAATTILRAGGSLEDVDKSLTAAGASTLAAGGDVTRAFDNVSTAVATGRSELLESSGIVTNASDAFESYAKSAGVSAKSLTQQQKVQALSTAIFKESKYEIADLDQLTGGLSGALNKQTKAQTELGNTVGRIVLPAVIGVTNGITKLLQAGNDWILNSKQIYAAGQALGKGFDGLQNIVVGGGRSILAGWQLIPTFFGSTFGNIGNALGEVGKGFFDFFKKVGDGFAKIATLDFKGGIADFAVAQTVQLSALGRAFDALKGKPDEVATAQAKANAESLLGLGQLSKGFEQLASMPDVFKTTVASGKTYGVVFAEAAAKTQAQAAASLAASGASDTEAASTDKATKAKALGTIAISDYKAKLDDMTFAQLKAAEAATRAAGDDQRFSLVQAEIKQRLEARQKGLEKVTKATDESAKAAQEEAKQLTAARAADKFDASLLTMREADLKVLRSKLEVIASTTGSLAKYNDAMSKLQAVESQLADVQVKNNKSLEARKKLLEDVQKTLNASNASRASGNAQQTAGGILGASQAALNTRDPLLLEDAINKSIALINSSTFKTLPEALQAALKANAANLKTTLAEILDARVEVQLMVQDSQNIQAFRDEIKSILNDLAPTDGTGLDVLAENITALDEIIANGGLPDDLKDLAAKIRDLNKAALESQTGFGGEAELVNSFSFTKLGEAAAYAKLTTSELAIEFAGLTDKQLAALASSSSMIDQGAVYKVLTEEIARRLQDQKNATDDLAKSERARADAVAMVANAQADLDARGDFLRMLEDLKPGAGDDFNALAEKIQTLKDILGNGQKLPDDIEKLYQATLKYLEFLAQPVGASGFIVVLENLVQFADLIDDIGGKVQSETDAAKDFVAEMNRTNEVLKLTGATNSTLADQYQDNISNLETLRDATAFGSDEWLIYTRALEAARTELEKIVPVGKDTTSQFQKETDVIREAADEWARHTKFLNKDTEAALAAQAAQAALASSIGQVSGAVAKGFDALKGEGGLGGLIDAAAGIAGLFGPEGQVVGAIISGVGKAAIAYSEFLESIDPMAQRVKAFKELEKQTKELAKGFEFIDEKGAAMFTSIESKSRGWLADFFVGPELSIKIDEIGVKFAKSLEGGVASGLRNGLKKNTWEEGLDVFRTDLGGTVIDALIDGFLGSEGIKAIIGPAIANLAKALADNDPTNDDAALAAFDAATTKLEPAFKNFYEGLSKVKEKFGLNETGPKLGSLAGYEAQMTDLKKQFDQTDSSATRGSLKREMDALQKRIDAINNGMTVTPDVPVPSVTTVQLPNISAQILAAPEWLDQFTSTIGEFRLGVQDFGAFARALMSMAGNADGNFARDLRFTRGL